MSFSHINLERFDDGIKSAQEKNADYKRGFSDGLAQATESDTAKRTQSITQVSSTLSDMSFGYEEARVNILRNLKSLLGQISEVVLPQIAKDTFGAHLLDVVESNFLMATDESIQISVAPNLVAALCNTHDEKRFSIIPDASLIEGQALIQETETQILLDLPALTLALQTALNGLELPERTQSNG